VTETVAETLHDAVITQLSRLRSGQSALALAMPQQIDALLEALAIRLEAETPSVLQENARDLAVMPQSDPRYDRLKLTAERIAGIADGLRILAGLPTPVGDELEARTLANGLRLTRNAVPLGVIGMIYEARPNVTVDAFGIAFKTQNAIALKGGSDAQHSNRALLSIIHSALEEAGLPVDCVTLLPPQRAAAGVLMGAVGHVDVIIPRGSQGLIDTVRDTAKVPVIETGAGVVHIYWDETGREDYARAIIRSAKTRRPSVCNAIDTLLVHRTHLPQLAETLEPLADANVDIRADTDSLAALTGHYPDGLLSAADADDYGTEFLGFRMSIKTVNDLEGALAHIDRHSSRHSEAIITEDDQNAAAFLQRVDAACVFHNTETGYSDGGEMELGAEIGISTQKLHARGPMGLAAMTSYKWIIRGEGQTRI
jgi:glutamate-5-semialdehyde dehydrogenase